MKYLINYVVGNQKESVIHEGDENSVEDVMYLMIKAYKCHGVWYTSTDTKRKGKDTKQTLNHVYGSLVSHGLAGVIG